MKPTRKQMEALKLVYQRHQEWMEPQTYLAFRRKWYIHSESDPYLFGPVFFRNGGRLWLGIEPDGYTHS